MIDAFTASFLLGCFITLVGMTLGTINFNDNSTGESQ